MLVILGVWTLLIFWLHSHMLIGEWFFFALIYHGHGMTFSHVDVLWNCLCSTRKYQGQIDSARPGPRCQRLHVSFSLPLLLYTYILSSHFIFLYIPFPCMLPSRTQASLGNAFSPFVSHAFMLRRHTVLTHMPSLFTFSLLGVRYSLSERGKFN